MSTIEPEDQVDEASATVVDEATSKHLEQLKKILNKTRHLLQLESKHLNYENEMIRMFGARIVMNERASANQRAGVGRHVKSNLFRHNTNVS